MLFAKFGWVLSLPMDHSGQHVAGKTLEWCQLYLEAKIFFLNDQYFLIRDAFTPKMKYHDIKM